MNKSMWLVLVLAPFLVLSGGCATSTSPAQDTAPVSQDEELVKGMSQIEIDNKIAESRALVDCGDYLKEDIDGYEPCKLSKTQVYLQESQDAREAELAAEREQEERVIQHKCSVYVNEGGLGLCPYLTF